jgi:hypothetical protein
VLIETCAGCVSRRLEHAFLEPTAVESAEREGVVREGIEPLTREKARELVQVPRTGGSRERMGHVA